MSVVALDRVVGNRSASAVAIQLARGEGRRMLRHPIMWVGVLSSIVTYGFFTWHAAPVLHRDDIFTAGALLPLAAATLIVANLASSRATRNATDEIYDTTSSSPGLRTIGHLVSLAYAVALASGLIGLMLVYMFLDAPVGTLRVAEIVVGPLTVALFGSVGVAIGRWNPHPALGPMAVVVAGALQYLLLQPIIGPNPISTLDRNPSPWLAPWVPSSMTGEVPSELVIRPAGWHLLYLVGLIPIIAAFALSRQGSRGRLLPLFIAGTAATIMGVVGQFTPASASQRDALADLLEHPEDHQVCEERRGVTYCAYPAYVGWIDRWAAPIEGALDRIPVDERPTDLTVRQRFGSYFEGPVDVPQETLRAVERAHRRGPQDDGLGTTLWTDTRWGRGATEGGYAIGLALAVTMEALDFPSSRAEIRPTPDEIALFYATVLPTIEERFRNKAARLLRPGRRLYGCHTAHQARAMVAMWIAGQATPATRAAVTSSATDSPYGVRIYETNGKRYATYIGPFIPLYPEVPPPMWDRVSFGEAEFHYAARLLSRPDEEVAAVIAERWDEITEPTAMTETFLGDLGLAPHETIENQIAGLPDDVKLERGGRRQWSSDASFGQTIPCL